jgi:hypothetical protein
MGLDGSQVLAYAVRMGKFLTVVCGLTLLAGVALGHLQMAGVAVVAVIFVAVAFSRGEKPGELDPDVWDKDPVKRARNLKLKTEAWRAGKPYTNPDELERFVAACEAAKAKPYSAPRAVVKPAPVRRGGWVRRHPMRAPVWEEYR